MAKGSYHHGDLRAALLTVAAEQIAAGGVDSVSLRELARRAGVSHAAPAHHFRDRRGLLTELAVEGFGLLADELGRAAPDLRELAVAYVRFALRNPGHFEVMFRNDLLHPDDPALIAARTRSGDLLRAGVADKLPEHDREEAGATALAAWSLVHGFASLWRAGALSGSALATDPDPEALARRMITSMRIG
ncbi:TetR/AcrR family transcriptional regulator [Actinosynnema sp. NPDC004786]